MKVSDLVVRPGGPADVELLDGLLRGLSADSAYLRFQTGIGTPSPRLLRSLLPERGAMFGFAEQEVVAHGLWVRHGKAAEIALVVADAHQRRGVGTALADALIADAAAHGITRIEAFSGSGNQAVARMVAHRAPHALRVLDGPTVTYTFSTSTSRTPTVRSSRAATGLGRATRPRPRVRRGRARRTHGAATPR